MSKKKDNKSKTWLRVVTLILGLGFAASTAAIGLSSMFSKNSSNVSQSNNTGDPTDIEAQIQKQVSGYEQVLKREPKNETALQGLSQIAQLYLQTGKTEKAIPVIETLVKHYPEKPEYAKVLQAIKQQQAQQGNKK
jgi:outer membrane protein assembly factor BamD (BamD/ComL family)